jgi:chromosome segregation ATPase
MKEEKRRMPADMLLARASAKASSREDLLERLHSLRTIVPVFAQELASARRQAAALRVENRRLQERVQELHRERDAARRQSSDVRPSHSVRASPSVRPARTPASQS